MLQNYIKTAFRQLSRKKSYLLLNTAGLGIALALCIFAYLVWEFDANFDKFHVHADKIFRVTTLKSGNQQMYGVCPAPLADLAKADLAGVRDAVVLDRRGIVMNQGENTFSEAVHFSGPSLFKWFSFPLVEGNVRLNDPTTILISERMAGKYFPDQNAIGQTLTLYAGDPRQKDLLVSGVFEDHPRNSSIYIDFVTHFSNRLDGNGKQVLSTDWQNWRDVVFLILDKPSVASDLLPQLNRYVSAHQAAMPNFNTQSFSLEPLDGMAHHAGDLRHNELAGSLPEASVWSNIVMAILLLLTASLNFTNTTISMAGNRLKEIGVRKVMGSSQRQLVLQLLAESFFICLLALGFGLALADWAANVYSQQWPFLDLKLILLDNLPLLAMLAGMVVLSTLMAGAYPAFYISSFNPNRIFKGTVKFGGSNLVSRLLVGIQVAISLVALIAGFTFARNAHFQQTADLGFTRTGIQAVEIDDKEIFEILNNEMQKNPLVLATAGVRSHLGDSCPRIDCSINGEKHETEYMTIGENYLELMDIPTLQGRSFNYRMETDYETAIMVNEKFVDAFLDGIDPIGQKVTFFDNLHCHIVGVVGNFMQDGFHDPLRPLTLKLGKAERFEYLVLKTEAEDMLPLRTALLGTWKEHFPLRPFEHHFQNDFFADTFKLTNNIKWAMLIIALVTLLLTVTGLYALISQSVMKRLKEIALRRVLGATAGNISFLINKNYVWIVGCGVLLGIFAGAWFSSLMLNSMYRVHAGISGLILTLAAAIAIAVLFISIAVKTTQVIKRNPAEVLQND